MFFFFTALTLAPLAQNVSLSFTAPLFTVFLAIIFLGEKSEFKRWGAMVIGFIGAWVVIRPGFSEVNIGSIYVICSSIVWAGSMTIIKYLSKIETSACDIGLCVNKKILESATSNILLARRDKIYSPINKFYKGTTLKFFEKKVGKIIKKNIFIKSLFEYDEIILVGSGKGVISVNNIKGTYWRRKSSKIYRFLSKIYYRAVTNCPRYNG